MTTKMYEEKQYDLNKGKELFEYYWQKWMDKKYKELLINERIVESDKQFMVNVILSMNVSTSDIKEAKQDPLYMKIVNLFEKLILGEASIEDIKKRYNTQREEILKGIDNLINEANELMLSRKLQEQIESIRGSNKSDEEKKKIINKIIEGSRKSRRNLEHIERIRKLEGIRRDFEDIGNIFKIEYFNKKSIEVNRDKIKYFAYVVYNPSILSTVFLEIHEEWEFFLFKWYLNKRPVTEMRKVFEYYRETKNIDQYIILQKENCLIKLREIAENKFLHQYVQSRANIIIEIINNFTENKYASVITLTLTTIEGLIWDYANIVNSNEGNLFRENNDSKMIVKGTEKNFNSSKVRDLLIRTKLSNYFDKNFLSYFCEELYQERNPILHGRCIHDFTELNAVKKLMTLQYIIEVINKYHKNLLFDAMEKDPVLMEVAEKLIRGELSGISNIPQEG